MYNGYISFDELLVDTGEWQDIAEAKENVQKKIASRIRELRQANRMTQEKISELIDCNFTTYKGYENLRSEIPNAYLIRLADLYNVSLDYIMGRTEDMRGMYAPEEDNYFSSQEEYDAYEAQKDFEIEASRNEYEERLTQIEKWIKEHDASQDTNKG